MRKDQSTLFNFFFVLFVMSVTSIMFVQNSFSQTDTVDIIKEIHASEIRVREHIDDKITNIDDKITNLTSNNDKHFKDLNDKYAELKGEVKGYSSKIEGLTNQLNSLDTRVNAILITIITVGSSFILFILSLLIKPWRQLLAELMRSTPQDTEKSEQSKEKTLPDKTQSDTNYHSERPTNEGQTLPR